jgi:hypothetical protein
MIVAEFTKPAVAAAAVPSWTNSRVTPRPLPALMRLRSDATRLARRAQRKALDLH